ncbi:tRNA preQ1(34) S-adenosylmethionine ribosyltransferase-isomerase QueA [Falsihalocynthiibacter sp. SS001]|uniref:tRNA preQ1(34) S-adenosylmethionine ribosyltransferase-isomerase QueA n=1 Tax=Falsihalocynthiibacter sp. SS001 TaxID=3349698 RepID=UPI0036D3B16D
MKLSDFDFELPEDLIAVRPVLPREAARMLMARGDTIKDLHVADLIDQFQAGDRLVLNDTKVIPARLFGTRSRDGAQGLTQAKMDVTLLEPRGDGTWMGLVKPLKKVKEGERIDFAEGLAAEVLGKEDGAAILGFNLEGDAFDKALEAAGAMPLPPYIAAKRPADAQDRTDYQTVFARHKGAVAAPTASLHLTEEMLAALEAKGVEITYVTLHVGAGTFLPVKVDDIADHKMHAEWGEVTEQAAQEIAATQKAGGRVIPVGTTALRLVETAARGGTIQPWVGPTDIFITPGFEFQVADGLMTNFHLPKSTLMMLVSAFLSPAAIRAIYAHAIAEKYRFFSYGDASLLWRK